MRIIVCAKHVVDSTEVRFDESTGQLILRNLPTKISDYDRNALEAAVVIKESFEDVTVEVLMIGDQVAQKSLKEAVAMGADKGYLVEGGWDDPFNPLLTARGLARGVEELGIPDLIFCGLVSEDGYNSLTGPALAELLDLPYLAPVVGIDLQEGHVRAALDFGETLREVRAAFPCVLAIDSSMNVPRLPTVLQVMKVKSDRLGQLSLDGLGLNLQSLLDHVPRVELSHYASGAVQRKGSVLEGPAATAVARLTEYLAQEGVLS